MSVHPSTPPAADPRPSLTPSDDSSILEELSFAYEVDSNGKPVRVTQDSSAQSHHSGTSFPPTPPDTLPARHPGITDDKSSAVPSRPLSARVDALVQSVGALNTSDSSEITPFPSTVTAIPSSRSFLRVASGPAGTNAVHRPMRVPRSTLEKQAEASEEPRTRQTSAGEANSKWSPPSSSASNAAANRYVGRSASIAGIPTTQSARKTPPDARVAPRRYGAARDAASYAGTQSADPAGASHDIGEDDVVDGSGTESGAPSSAHARNASRHRSYGMVDALPPSMLGHRPRRSASFSEGPLAEDAPPANPPTITRSSTQTRRPQSSLESYQGQRVMRTEDVDPVDYDRDYLQAQAYVPSASPTHVQSAGGRPQYSHQRKDSETLRSFPASSSAPSLERIPQREVAPSSASSVAGTSVSAARPLRRTPTMSDSPVMSGLAPMEQPGARKSWDGSDNRNVQAPEKISNGHGAREREGQWSRMQHMEPPKPPASSPPVLHVHPPAGAVAQPQSAVTPVQYQQQPAMRNIIVNKRCYIRLDLVGKGGTSRVYRVMSEKNELYAIKRVALDKADHDTMKGYMNEIALLKRLDGNNRIIRLIDSEAKMSGGNSKGYLHLVMECGEIDLARLVQEQQKKPMNLVWIAYYWQQMLEAVHVIHEEKIVHSDLKPANFVLVRGQLKLIDFGIANAIANDTTNIQRDHQIGTVNYMSPEAIEVPEGMRRLKVGRPSDVWSLGCILYQMVYGHPPFFHLSHVVAKMRAIPDPSHVIEFPDTSTPSPVALPNLSEQERERMRRKVRKDVILSMKCCLCRNPKERATIPDLLEQQWLAMPEPEAPPPPAARDLLADNETIIDPFYMQQLLEYGISLGQGQQGHMDEEKLVKEAERLVKELKQVQASGQ